MGGPLSPPDQRPIHDNPLGWAVVLFAALAWWWLTLAYAKTISATFDEPLHVAAGVRALTGDFSVNPEHPPLMKYLAGLGTSAHVNPPPATVLGDPTAGWAWAVRSLYGLSLTGDSAVQSARFAMSFVGLALVGSLIGLGYWYGGWAGLLAAGLVVGVDPLLRGHGALVTNDVLLTLCTLWASVAVAAWWKRPSLFLAVAVALAVGLACISKHNGLVLAALVALVAVAKVIVERKARGVVLLLAITTIIPAIIWAAYGFRFAPTPDATLHFDLPALRTRAEVANRQAGGDGNRLALTATTAAEQYHLLPESYLAGLVHSYGVTRFNAAFADGQYFTTGQWWYFPYAASVKMPLGSLALVAMGFVLAVRRIGVGVWILMVGLAASLVTSPLNIGLRHALPLMAVLTFAMIRGCAGCRWRGGIAIIFALMATGEVIATVATRTRNPGIAWFNKFAGKETELLGDSNLDWGQGLVGLARWQRENPSEKIYLAYFGTADPRSYGIVYQPIPGPAAYEFGPPASPPTVPGVIAVSATVMQGIYGKDDTGHPGPPPFYARLLKNGRPIDIVGNGSIYLFRWDGTTVVGE